MSTTLVNHFYVEPLNEFLDLEPPVIVQEHAPRKGAKVYVTIGEVLSSAVVQSDHQRKGETILGTTQNFDAEVKLLLNEGKVDQCRKIIHEAFEAQGIHITEVPLDTVPSDAELKGTPLYQSAA